MDTHVCVCSCAVQIEQREEGEEIIDVVDEINCQLSIIIVISFSFDLTLCAYRIIKTESERARAETFSIFICQVIVIA